MQQRNKNIILVLGFAVVLFMAYKLSISKTIELKQEIAMLKSEVDRSEELPVLLANLSSREKYADSILNVNNIENVSIQNNLLELLNRQSLDTGVRIVEFSQPHKFVGESVNKTSFQFKLEGEYNQIERIIHLLEQEYNLGEVINLHFEKKRDYRRGMDYLECQVILESFDSE
ncbi:MAG: hypothetical protein DWP94_15210 [Flavobacterium sp.]|nr:MAG: hypothetical protein DWP94_15210 [Flavobacterium sp.]